MGDSAEADFADFYAATWARTLAVTYALTGDRGAAEEIAQEADWPPAPCATTTSIDVDGVRVRHDSMPDGADAGSSLWVGDVWSARIGADVAELQVVTASEVADPAVAEEVAEALVAGLRDGWTQTTD